MNPRISRPALAAGVLAAASLALAQPGVQPKPQAPRPQPGSLVIPPPTPQYDALVKRDANGKIIPVYGCLDAVALARNPMVDAATREKMRPTIADWTADVNQIVVDNIDFLERLRDGFFDTYLPADPERNSYLQHMTVQLTAAGPLSARLQQQNPALGGAFSLNMRMTNEYIQGVYAELQGAPSPAPLPGGQPEPDQQRMQRNSNNVSRFFQGLSTRDAFEQYRRILVDAAPLVDRILPALPESARAKAQPTVGAVKAATDDTAKLVAVNDLLNQLSFDDKRAFLAKAVALGAAPDPFNPAPPFPPAAKPAGTPEAAAAPKAPH